MFLPLRGLSLCSSHSCLRGEAALNEPPAPCGAPVFRVAPTGLAQATTWPAAGRRGKTWSYDSVPFIIKLVAEGEASYAKTLRRLKDSFLQDGMT